MRKVQSNDTNARRGRTAVLYCTVPYVYRGRRAILYRKHPAGGHTSTTFLDSILQRVKEAIRRRALTINKNYIRTLITVIKHSLKKQADHQKLSNTRRICRKLLSVFTYECDCSKQLINDRRQKWGRGDTQVDSRLPRHQAPFNYNVRVYLRFEDILCRLH